MFLRGLNLILDGGEAGVDLGLAIISRVLIILTFVMILIFEPNVEATLEQLMKELFGFYMLPEK